MSPNPTTRPLNDIDLAALGEVVAAIQADPAAGQAHMDVETTWKGQVRSETRTRTFRLGEQIVEREHVITADEPNELLGTNVGPNPQELMMAAMNACMTVGFVAGCSAAGIALESLSLRTRCDIDLRGFLDLAEGIPAGAPTWHTDVQVKGDGTPEQYAIILEHVKKTSPNFFHVIQPIAVETTIDVR